MDILAEFIKNFGTQLSAVGAAIAFVFAVYKFVAERNAIRFWKEFDAYHKLVKELVEPTNEQGTMYVDRQTAAIFELRFYHRYYPHSLRMLKHLRVKWAAVPDQYPRLIEEMDLTIRYIEKT
ncbi:hypothetical protein [Neptunicella sp. SCSIO 80796]|uniref:hypothetical protein n=1 Tax=Neptunicella plasticusilytica TaxID=3117012 RepID=UPI003A4D877E